MASRVQSSAKRFILAWLPTPMQWMLVSRIKRLVNARSIVRRLDQAGVRGHDHGWMNLGLVGTKP